MSTFLNSLFTSRGSTTSSPALVAPATPATPSTVDALPRKGGKSRGKTPRRSNTNGPADAEPAPDAEPPRSREPRSQSRTRPRAQSRGREPRAQSCGREPRAQSRTPKPHAPRRDKSRRRGGNTNEGPSDGTEDSVLLTGSAHRQDSVPQETFQSPGKNRRSRSQSRARKAETEHPQVIYPEELSVRLSVLIGKTNVDTSTFMELSGASASSRSIIRTDQDLFKFSIALQGFLKTVLMPNTDPTVVINIVIFKDAGRFAVTSKEVVQLITHTPKYGMERDVAEATKSLDDKVRELCKKLYKEVSAEIKAKLNLNVVDSVV